MPRLNFIALAAGVLSLSAATSALAVGPGGQAPPVAVSKPLSCCIYKRAPGTTQQQFQASCTAAGGIIVGNGGDACQINGRRPNDPPPPGLVGQSRERYEPRPPAKPKN